MADFGRILQKEGHEVKVLCGDADYLYAPYDQNFSDPPISRELKLFGKWSEQGTQLFETETIQSSNLHNLSAIEETIEQFHPDVCLVGNIDLLQFDASLLHKILEHNIPTAHYVMNAQPGYSWQSAPRNSKFRYITCSDWIRYNLASTKYPMTGAKTIYPGACVDDFYSKNIPDQAHLNIAYASLVAPYKGIDILIEALYLLHSNEVEFNATIAGGTFVPGYVDEIQSFLESEGLSKKVKLVGALSRKELVALYRSHNILVFPSRFDEPFGISQIEAMAAGLTLVTSGTGGAKEIVNSHGEDGFFFEPEDPIDLSNVLASISKDKEIWRSVALRGQENACSRFSQEKATADVEKFLVNML